MRGHSNILIITFIAIFLIVGGYFYLINNPINVGSSKNGDLINVTQPSALNDRRKEFTSSHVMKFSISVPNEYEVVEQQGSAEIKADSGTIHIGMNGTNFDNLNDYIESRRNNIKNRITNKKESVVNNLQAISGDINKERTYFIYADNTVYIISTSSESLYDDLDQIAKSFKYTP